MSSWSDEYERNHQAETIKAELRQVRNDIKVLHAMLREIHGFVRYVDATAPELRTAYQVSKRIE